MNRTTLPWLCLWLCVSSVAYANNPTIVLEGTLDTQLGVISQDNKTHEHDFVFDVAAGVLRDYAFTNDTHIMVKMLGKTKYMSYGGEIKLNNDVSASKDKDNNIAEKTMAYVAGEFGRVEAGSYTGASLALQVSAVNIAKATGGIDGDSRYWWNDEAGDTDYPRNTDDDLLVSDLYLTVPQLYTNNPILVGIKGVNASKITYYTPKYHGFIAGVSYIPDLTSYGTVFKAMQVFQDTNASTDTDGMNPSIYSAAPYKNIFEGGVRYDGRQGPVSISAALLGQTGTPKRYLERIDSSYGVHISDIVLFNKLRAWEAGLALGYRNITIAAGYGSNNKSGEMLQDIFMTNKIKPTVYWNIGAAYDNGKLGFSATYMQSKRGLTAGSTVYKEWGIFPEQPKFTMISVGGDYRIASGCKVYGEVNVFKVSSIFDNESGEEFPGASMKNDGSVILIGMKNRF